MYGRNSDPDSIFFGGLNTIRTIPINFAKRETSGYDFSVAYLYEWEEHTFDFGISGTKVDELNDFTNPNDLSVVDPELGEIQSPELAGNVELKWSYGDWTLGWQGQYVDEMLLAYVEIETAETLYGPSIMQDDMWVHDLNFTYNLDEDVQLYGGINNLTDEEPFITSYAYPVSARGRYAFLGFNIKM